MSERGAEGLGYSRGVGMMGRGSGQDAKGGRRVFPTFSTEKAERSVHFRARCGVLERLCGRQEEAGGW